VSAEHFFIVGAQRSGTTHLCHLLAAHPEIEMATPFRPEPKFFLLDDLFARGLAYYEDTFFGRKPQAQLRGEKTVSYMESDKAARRIADCYPRGHIVFLLRDPIERAISHYWFSVENGVETLGMEEAFRREDRESDERWQRLSMSPFSYLRRGCYVQDVMRYEELFGRDQLKILLYEELVRERGTLENLCRWLGVSDRVQPEAPAPSLNLGARWGDGVPAPLWRELAEYFAEPTAELASRYGLDLRVWTEHWADAKSNGLSAD
jgi:hypothetical protein